MAVRAWLRPPRRVLLLLVGVTVLLGATLAWLGWRLLEQDRALEAQQLRGQVEGTADQIADALRPHLDAAADSVSRLAGLSPVALRPALAHSAAALAEDAALILLTLDAIEAFPARRLPYQPLVPAPAPEPAGTFAAAESLEFRGRDFARAAAALQRLARATAPTVRAGALLRLGRVLRKAGRLDSALAVYDALARDSSLTLEALPAELLARHARVAVLEAAGRPGPARVEADSLYRDLLHGRWVLTAGSFAFYAGDLRPRVRDGRAAALDSAAAPALALAHAADSLWTTWRGTDSASRFDGQRNLRVGQQPVFLMWRGNGARAVALLAGPEHLERRMLGAVRAQLAGRRQLVLMGLLTAALIVAIGLYAVTRAVSREIEVARLQSDFVSAVSHEFRTPLTTLRQLTELLAGGRVVSEERRATYYDTIRRESERLHRLVEGLLDFGRMEAGALEFRLEPLEATEFVRELVVEFQREVEGRGYRVAFSAINGSCPVRADREALGRAVWNLLDNAVKYSPDDRAVSVKVGHANGAVAIGVQDRGIGIPAAELSRIFEKFVRGSGSGIRSVKGTGIGLAMVRHIVTAHGGSVQVESTTGSGSTFTIILPPGGQS